MHTIHTAETQLFLALLQLVPTHPIANDWLTHLPTWLAAIKDKHRYAHAPYYASLIERLPTLDNVTLDLNPSYSNFGCISAEFDWTEREYKQTVALLKKLMPWRKGGFLLGNAEKQIHIDTEWRSDYKWDRVLPHISPLKNRRVLDVGGGSGYHGWRMAGEGAKLVIVIDPSCLFYHQFMVMKHFSLAQNIPVHYIPVPLEALPYDNVTNKQLFDTVFSMGVLYHRASPFEHLELLKKQLVKGGELILETLVIDGDETAVLVPKERYAQMNNVYFLPSVPALTVWLQKVGFVAVRCVEVDVTSTEEQRATEWMDYQSLSDFLDPNDTSKTLEGYPRPKRAVLIAKKG